MSSLSETHYTPQEYLSLERGAGYRSEYFAGHMYAMSGASRERNIIAVNIASARHAAFAARHCEAYMSDMRVKVGPTVIYTYPDVAAVCGEPHFEDDHLDTLLNPTVIIEILSPSTEAYDRGEKFAHCRRLASLNDYVLVAQDKARVEHFVRQGGSVAKWMLTEHSGLDSVLNLASIGCALPLRDIYAKIDL